MTLLWPVGSDKVSPGGSYRYDRGASHVPRYHQGVDAQVPVGTKIFGSGPGRITAVINTGTTSGFGLYVQAEYAVPEGTLQVRTAHQSVEDVTVGQTIDQNTLLGESGGAYHSFGAGDSNGPHCHVETHLNGVLVDPHLWLTSRSSISDDDSAPTTPLTEEEEMPLIQVTIPAPAPRTGTDTYVMNPADHTYWHVTNTVQAQFNIGIGIQEYKNQAPQIVDGYKLI